MTKAFHLSAASLDTSSAKSGDIQVLLTSDNNVYILCTLNKDSDKQRQLDLNFAEGDKICFAVKGEGIVHLTGFLIPDSDDFMDMSDEEEEESAVQNKENAGKKKEKNPLLKLVSGEDDSDSDEMDDTFDPTKENKEDESEDDSDEEAGVEEEDSDDDDDDEDGEEESDEDDSDEEEEDQEPAKKAQKGHDGQKIKQNGVENGKASSKEQKKDKAQSGPKTLTGGVQVLDMVPGNGPEAKPGKKVSVYYEGRLKANNKVFDSTKKGNGFKFKLGGGEVIKGWDVGVAGMKVGGKRRITCPPNMAYGQKGSPPVIPQNATLVFDVEPKNVL